MDKKELKDALFEYEMETDYWFLNIYIKFWVIVAKLPIYLRIYLEGMRILPNPQIADKFETIFKYIYYFGGGICLLLFAISNIKMFALSLIILFIVIPICSKFIGGAIGCLFIILIIAIIINLIFG